jgi:hypothetical protein
MIIGVPDGFNVQTGSKDINTLTKVREVCTLIKDGRGTNSDGLFSTSRRIVTTFK